MDWLLAPSTSHLYSSSVSLSDHYLSLFDALLNAPPEYRRALFLEVSGFVVGKWLTMPLDENVVLALNKSLVGLSLEVSRIPITNPGNASSSSHDLSTMDLKSPPPVVSQVDFAARMIALFHQHDRQLSGARYIRMIRDKDDRAPSRDPKFMSAFLIKVLERLEELKVPILSMFLVEAWGDWAVDWTSHGSECRKIMVRRFFMLYTGLLTQRS